jgi:hypothetical protein
MKLAAPPCTFKCYNQDNPTGSDSKKYYVSEYSFSQEAGEVSDLVSGGLYVDGITVSANISVKSPLGLFTGTASFAFPARHWAFALDGHATLAERDAVTKTVDLIALLAGIPTPGSFAVTAEIESVGQDIYEDYSAV